MGEKSAPTVNPQALLEQYLEQAEGAEPGAAADLIRQVLEAPGVYVFGELLDVPSIQELNNHPQFAPYFQLLHLFAFGNYSNFLENKAQYPELTPGMVSKLRHLTIVSLATKNKCIPYPLLLQELDLRNLRELEDVIIEAVYADVVRGKLDQRNGRLEVERTIGRDIRPSDVDTVISVLQEWTDGCKAVLGAIESQIAKANLTKEAHLKRRQQVEAEVTNIKKNLKVQSQDGEEHLEMRDASTPTEKPSKKNLKGKGIKSGGKFWHHKSST